jgi:ethanolamine utilization protein EutP (predicted NTPase)
MAIPTTSLAPLNILTPQITGSTLSVDSTVLPFVINADLNTTRVEISIYGITHIFTNFTIVGSNNQFTGTITLNPNITSTQILFVGRNYDPNNPPNNPKITPSIQIVLLFFNSGFSVMIGPPTGVRSYQNPSSCTIEWVTPPFPGFIGVRLLLSTDKTGVNVPYQQYGDLISSISRTADVVTGSSTATAVTTGVTTITTTQSTEVANYSNVDVPQTFINNDIFYAMVSTVIQDPSTNAVYESQLNGPITCGFIDLKKVNPTDFLALQRKEDIAGRLISQINRIYPDLDLSPRSELRDTFIDPIALELSTMSVREWFSRISQSISALSQFDDGNGDGFSDTLAESSAKQQVARAYGLNSTDVQSLIDKQFDILGEQAGILRGGSTTAVSELTFYTFVKPTVALSIPQGAIVATIPDAETPALNFVTRGSAVINSANVDSLYSPAQGWWSVTLPCECLTPGKIGNVGAGTISHGISNIPSNFSVQNLSGATGGSDSQSNSKYASLIQARLITGVDSGTRNGYLVASQQIPEIEDVKVVAAGDVEMVRDWDSLRQKHIFGSVDLYVRGESFSQQSSNTVLSYTNTGTYQLYSSYQPLTLLDAKALKFTIKDFSSLPYPVYTAIELIVQRGSNSFYLGTQKAQIDIVNGIIILDPSEAAYTLSGDDNSIISPLLLNNIPANNTQAVQNISGIGVSNYTFSLFARLHSGILNVSNFQPVLQVFSVVGPNTGTIPPANVDLIHSSDFFLLGNSNEAGDVVRVNRTTSLPQTKVVQFLTSTFTSNTTPILIDSGMDIPLNSSGLPVDVLSVRSSDLTTLYRVGVDYTIIPTDRYHTYGIKPLVGGSITPGSSVIIAYNKFIINELMNFNSNELQVLVGSNPTTLSNAGFVQNVWQPISYGNTSLTADSALISAGVSHSKRYIKITFNNGISDVVMKEGLDFTLSVDPISGAASITRILTGYIPDGGSIKVSYFNNEVFQINTKFPTFVGQLVDSIQTTKHAGADVVVKSMVENPVDITLTVELESNALPAVIDPRIRTAIGIVLDKASGKLAQSELVRQIKAVTGVSNVELPLLKCAKSDGSYDIGLVIPTSAPWTSLIADPSFANLNISPNAYITTNKILANSTKPSGGDATAFAGLLYEGESYRRASSVKDFLFNSTVPSFYIIGVNDEIDDSVLLDPSYSGKILIQIPSSVASPGLRSYRVTYQVWFETEAKDIVMSSTEYLSPGKITINYV